MFRASACFLFIVCISTLAAATAHLSTHAAGLSGLSGFIVGITLFVLILTVSVMLLAAINDRMNK